MKLLVVLAFAGMVVWTVSAGAEPQARSDRVKDPAAPCLKNPAPKQPLNQLDFSGNSSGLVFDPFAPGGARPAAKPESQRAGVDPTTVTLFPPTETTTTAINESEDHEDKKPCP